jgi:hypothetical protein
MSVTHPPPTNTAVVYTDQWHEQVKRSIGARMDQAIMYCQRVITGNPQRGLFEFDSVKDEFCLSLKISDKDRDVVPYLHDVEEVWILTRKQPYED